jgi:hypothetical protein
MNNASVQPKRRIKWRRVCAVVSLLIIVVVVRACFLRPGTDFPGSHFNRGQNAAWLGVPVRVPPGTPGEPGYVDLADETVQSCLAC